MVPGWYGKVPSLGDFASRRLPGEFTVTWDAWLQDMLRGTRAALGDAWLEAYMTMPIWRFVLLHGLIGPGGWAGLLMPSVDRVGRPFPLTLVVPLASRTDLAHAVVHGDDWFARMEEAALSVLDVSRGPDDLERLLADRPFTPPPPASAPVTVGVIAALASVETFGTMIQADAMRVWAEHGGWKALWWTRGRVDGQALSLVSAALPTVDEFLTLLESRSSGLASETDATTLSSSFSEP